MANDLKPLMDKILAGALIHARESHVLTAMINSDMSTEARQKSSTIDFQVTVPLGTYDIVPGPYRTTGGDVSAVTVPLKLDKWKGSGFSLTRKEMGEIDARKLWIPNQVQEAVNAVVGVMAHTVADTYYKIPYLTGTPGQPIFQRVATPTQDYEDTFILPQSYADLSERKVPLQNRKFVMGIPEYNRAQRLEAFRDASKLGTSRVAQQAQLGLVGGFETGWQHYIPEHTAGTLTANVTASGAHAAGVTAVTLATDATGVVALKRGDIITFAGSTSTYSVQADLNVGSSATGIVTLDRGLEAALAGAEAVSVKASHRVNFAFHPNAFALAVRRREDMEIPGLPTAALHSSLQDNEPGVGTGLVLTLSVWPEHHQAWFEVSALWGTECVLPWLAQRVAG